MSQLPFMQQLEAHGNELEVRERIAKGLYHGEHLGIATEWLRRKDETRSSAASARAEEREEAMLSTARDANAIAEKARSVARHANIIAISAMILSVATAIIVAVIQFISQKPSP